jgi:hypothetical protein
MRSCLNCEHQFTKVDEGPCKDCFGYSNWKTETRIPPPDITPKETDPSGLDQHEPGAKVDHGKPQPELVLRDMASAIAAVIDVATYGAEKYSPKGWLQVDNAFERYQNAMCRHKIKRDMGDRHDDDSHCLHLAHEAWNALACLQLYLAEAPFEEDVCTECPE